jgi:hypothetical protein
LKAFSLENKVHTSQDFVKCVHYTSSNNAIDIIKGRTFWMRNAKCMNDFQELTHGYTIISDYFKDKEKNKEFRLVVDQIDENFEQDVVKGFEEWWEAISYNTYILSLSEHSGPDEIEHGRLSMWRAYSNGGSKCALEISLPTDLNTGNSLVVTPVSYLKDSELSLRLDHAVTNVKKLISEYKHEGLDKNELVKFFILALIDLTLAVKHPGFKEEREWRVYYIPNIMPDRTEHLKNDVEIVVGIPQIVYKIPVFKPDDEKGIDGYYINQIIKGILIGPSSYPKIQIDAFRKLLDENGLKAAKVSASFIPLRG